MDAKGCRGFGSFILKKNRNKESNALKMYKLVATLRLLTCIEKCI